MENTRIKITNLTIVKTEPIIAYFTLNINEFEIRNMKLIRNEGDIHVGYPSQYDNKLGRWFRVVSANSRTTKSILDLALKEYYLLYYNN